ncbi:hypothetical protein [Clostridium cylindrosporum]|uniref:Uncharacterized protein n=1 Tax=Clostridium cylindrosporum DSM 605 TaxID=1121307 RepID=A0A0J8G201_CLOCY|nr:hypothetical protein [Clostridium cylindrosporum]KMT21791.1 hypothetical protein CLCY_3c00580 [Clostridium cylindrosporum DSM 605]
MKKIVRKKNINKENNITHISCENNSIWAKVVYTPSDKSNEFLYSLVIGIKDTGKEMIHDIGSFNMVKAKNQLSKVVIENNKIRIIPRKLPTAVYNLHERDIQEYIFSINEKNL